MMEDMMYGYAMGLAENVEKESEKSNWAFSNTLWILILLTLPTFGESDIAKAMMDAGFEKVKEISENAKQLIPKDEQPAAADTDE